jgi:hypothetical protein
LLLRIFLEDQLVVKVIYQKDKYGELENLAELEGFNTQQIYTGSSSSPNRTHSKEVEPIIYNRSPIQTSPLQVSPLSMLSNQTNYSLWSTHEESVLADTPAVDSRLSPNAQEFRYPVTKQQTLPSPTNILYQSDSRYSEYPSYMWSSLTEPVERRQGYASLQSFYSNWLDNSNSYKRNYNTSQLEIMA